MFTEGGYLWVPALSVSAADLLERFRVVVDGVSRRLSVLVETGERSDTTQGTPPRYLFEPDTFTRPPWDGSTSAWVVAEKPVLAETGGYCIGWGCVWSRSSPMGWNTGEITYSDFDNVRRFEAVLDRVTEDGAVLYSEVVRLSKPLIGAVPDFSPYSDITLSASYQFEPTEPRDAAEYEACFAQGLVAYGYLPPVSDGTVLWPRGEGGTVLWGNLGYYQSVEPSPGQVVCVAWRWYGAHGNPGKPWIWRLSRPFEGGGVLVEWDACPAPPDDGGPYEPEPPFYPNLLVLAAVAVGLFNSYLQAISVTTALTEAAVANYGELAVLARIGALRAAQGGNLPIPALAPSVQAGNLPVVYQAVEGATSAMMKHATAESVALRAAEEAAADAAVKASLARAAKAEAQASIEGAIQTLRNVKP